MKKQTINNKKDLEEHLKTLNHTLLMEVVNSNASLFYQDYDYENDTDREAMEEHRLICMSEEELRKHVFNTLVKALNLE